MGVYWFISVRPSFRSSVRPLKIFVKDFSTAMNAREIFLHTQIDDDFIYPGIANPPSPAYSSLYLSDFLSFHTLLLIMKFFVTGFC